MKNAHILIAGDTHTSNSMRQLVLEAAGYHVVTATDAYSALEAAKHTAFELAVVDGLLPFASVQHLLRAFRSRGIHTLLLAPREICEALLPLASVAMPFDDAYTLPRVVESLLVKPPQATDAGLPLGVGLETASAGDHFAWLCADDADLENAIRFLAAGFARNETSIVLGRERQKQQCFQLLENLGADIPKLLASLNLVWIDPSDCLLEGGNCVERFRQLVISRPSLVRVMAAIGLGSREFSDSELLQFERQLDGALHGTRSIAVCLYDLNQVSAKQLFFAGLGHHSMLVTPHGVVREHLSLGTALF